jgi:hypothetical protein
MSFRITGLSPANFSHLFGLSDDDLAKHNAIRMQVTSKPGFPDRIELRDLEIGETALLVNHTHQPADTPYRASHAIFVREFAHQAFDTQDVVPDVMRIRTLSIRAFDASGMMLDADLTEGARTEDLILRMFANPAVEYLHIHYAKRGCFAATVQRV